jgi:hypothetical protein
VKESRIAGQSREKFPSEAKTIADSAAFMPMRSPRPPAKTELSAKMAEEACAGPIRGRE